MGFTHAEGLSRNAPSVTTVEKKDLLSMAGKNKPILFGLVLISALRRFHEYNQHGLSMNR
jgi:hypothetical protein